MFGKGQRNYIKPQGTRRKGKRRSKGLNISQLKPEPLALWALSQLLTLDLELEDLWARVFSGRRGMSFVLRIRILRRERRELKDDKTLTTGSGHEF